MRDAAVADSDWLFCGQDFGQNKQRTRAPQHRPPWTAKMPGIIRNNFRQACCVSRQLSVVHDCCRQSLGTFGVPGDRLLKGIVLPRALLARSCGTLDGAYVISTEVLRSHSCRSPRWSARITLSVPSGALL
jgi:hypothetical protein